ncbi:hypothetical protein [Planococcus sp. YIM B11945]|uniref:hypothetical protein n=1 Tax=Planococcus sp. YIM B11945 TaxID=3435410 RepID=UPI003D7DC5DC
MGITLIVGAFGLILLTFQGNPLEEWKSKERMYAYIETRQQHSAEIIKENEFAVVSTAAINQPNINFFPDNDNSCEKPLPK